MAGDGSGDIGAFCRGVAKLLLEDGVDIRTSVTASRVEVENGSVVGVTTTAGFVPCDNVVVASGTHTPKFLTPHGIDAPIYAVKGFMLSFTSSTSIDYNLMLPQKAFVAPMYDELGQKFYRGSGFAEFEGDVGNWEENKWGKGATLEGEDLRRIGKLQVRRASEGKKGAKKGRCERTRREPAAQNKLLRTSCSERSCSHRRLICSQAHMRRKQELRSPFPIHFALLSHSLRTFRISSRRRLRTWRC